MGDWSPSFSETTVHTLPSQRTQGSLWLPGDLKFPQPTLRPAGTDSGSGSIAPSPAASGEACKSQARPTPTEFKTVVSSSARAMAPLQVRRAKALEGQSTHPTGWCRAFLKQKGTASSGPTKTSFSASPWHLGKPGGLNRST